MPGSKDRTSPGWKDGTHWYIRQSQSWLKSNVDGRARKVGIMKSSPPEDQGARQKVG
jgi:predicted heme/steroid binding protein